MPEQVRTLPADHPQEREIRGGERHSWSWSVRGGDLGRLEVTELGIDVIVRLFQPQEQDPELEVDGLGGEWGVEELSACPDTDTHYRVEIEALSPRAPQGRYRLIASSPAAAAERDRTNARAERHFDTGERARRLATEEGRRASLAHYQEALDLFSRSDGARGILDSLQRLGFLHEQLGERSAARSFYQQLLELSRRLPDRREEGVTLNRLGNLDHSEENNESALQLFEQALAISEELEDGPLRASSLNNLAMLRLRQEDLAGALRDLQAVSRLWQELQRPLERANALFNLNFVLQAQGKYPEALDALNEALSLRRQSDDRPATAQALLQIGTVRQLMLQPEAAAEAFEQALVEGADELTADLKALLANNLGLVEVQLGKSDDAQRRFEEVLQEARRLKLLRHEAMASLNLGALHQKRTETADSLRLLTRAREIFTGLDDRRHLAACSLLEGLNLRDQGSPEAALERLEAAVEEVEELRLQHSGWALRMAFFATRQTYYDELVDLLFELSRSTGNPSYGERALYASERRRARSLLDAVAEGRLAFRGDASLLDLERRQSEKLAEISRELRLAAGDSQPELDRRERQLLLQLESTRTEIHRSSPQYAELTRPHPLQTAAIRKAVLDGETRLLVYSLGDERSLLFTLGLDEPLEIFELPGRERIARAVDKARTALTSLSRTRQSQNRLFLQQLSDLILGPVAQSLDHRRLAIVADGPLETVPFAALPEPVRPGEASPTGPETRPWLLEGREIVYLPSASALAALRAEVAGRPAAPYEIAVFADPVFTSDDPRVSTSLQEGEEPTPILQLSGVRRNQSLGEALTRLPDTATEAKAIRDLVSHPDSSLFALGFEASRRRFEDRELGEFRTLHFATHGFLDPVNPELSGLALSMVDEAGKPVDGFVRAHELYSRRLGADLVVLSACQTGLGRQVEGEGLVGLPRGFLYAGVPRVIISLWNVADDSTARLMGRFYAGLRDGLAPAAALRKAQLDLLHSQDESVSTPFHWAPFIFLGDWRPPGQEKRALEGGMGSGGDGTTVGSDPAKGAGYGVEADPPVKPTEQDSLGTGHPRAGAGREGATAFVAPEDFVNGVDGDTGALLPPEPEGQAANLRLDHQQYRHVTHWAENRDQLRLPIYGVDPEKIEEAGWAVLFGPDVDQDTRDALQPLLKRREEQAGSLFQTIDLPAGADPLAFLAGRGVAFGPAIPEKLPYYLLLVGDPHRLPFEFQYRLDVQYAVGRIHFEQASDYRRYADHVLRAETSTDTERPAVFWGTEIPGDENSRWMMAGLVDPLVEDLREWREDKARGLYDVQRARDGRKATLGEILHAKTPAFLFTASHGMMFSQDPESRRELQGALVCEDWKPGQRPVPREAFYSAQDLDPNVDLAGLIAFHFACYSTGCSSLDPFERGPVGQGRYQDDRSFVARLSQRLLTQGAQAVVGHIDRAFRTSFTWQQEGDQTRVFSSMLRQLFAGHRLGHATEGVNTRYAEFASDLNPLLEQLPRPGTATAKHLENLRRATLDARNYLVIGDPAVRLVGSQVRQVGQKEG